MEYIPLLCSCLFCRDRIGLPQSIEMNKYFPWFLKDLNQFSCFTSLSLYLIFDVDVKNWLL